MKRRKSERTEHTEFMCLRFGMCKIKKKELIKKKKSSRVCGQSWMECRSLHSELCENPAEVRPSVHRRDARPFVASFPFEASHTVPTAPKVQSFEHTDTRNFGVVANYAEHRIRRFSPGILTPDQCSDSTRKNGWVR